MEIKIIVTHLIYALLFSTVICDVPRLEDGTLLEDFSVVNMGHMGYPTILMYIEQLAISECADTCRRHLSCVTFNYNWNTRACELVDQKFDTSEAIVDNPNWYNYGIPEKIDGGWSNWMDTSCSVTCGNGKLSQYRTCTAPEPKYGGAPCVGDEVRTVSCNAGPCPINGGWTAWMIDSSCTFTCGDGTMDKRRTCTNPKPEFGGATCFGKDIQTVHCNTGVCPPCKKHRDGGCCKFPYYFNGRVRNNCWKAGHGYTCFGDDYRWHEC